MSRKVHNKEAGYIAERTNPYFAKTKVVIYNAEQQGMDATAGKYIVVCDAHGTLVNETSVPRARLSMKDPSNFCDECRAIKEKVLG